MSTVLNKNNFIRFTGSFRTPPFSMYATIGVGHFYANEDFIVIQPFVAAACFASLGINPLTFQVTEISTPLSADCQWDGVANLTIYRPIDLTVTDFFVIFNFTDYAGNTYLSAALSIIMSPVIVAWVTYPASATCQLDSFGNNNGYQNFEQLKLINAATLTDISPLTLKDNVISDPDYVAPTQNLVSCPAPASSYAPLIIGNFSQNNADANPNDTIIITNIYLASSGAGPTNPGYPLPIALNIPCNIAPGRTQRFNIPTGVWDIGLTITYTVTPGGNMTTATPQRFWITNNAGSLSGWPSGGTFTNPVTNASIYGANPLTIPPTATGINIYAQ